MVLGRQFGQLRIPDLNVGIGAPKPYPDYDPGPDHGRGQVGVGQTVMNFDAPDAPLTVGGGDEEQVKWAFDPDPTHPDNKPMFGAEDRHSFVYVDDGNDPDWDENAYTLGGIYAPSQSHNNREWSETLARGWGEAPLERIGPDRQIRSGQAMVQNEPVEILRQVPEFDTDPWVANVAGKDYLLDGHHRVSASRRRGDGSIDARVVRGKDWHEVANILTQRERR